MWMKNLFRLSGKSVRLSASVRAAPRLETVVSVQRDVFTASAVPAVSSHATVATLYSVSFAST